MKTVVIMLLLCMIAGFGLFAFINAVKAHREQMAYFMVQAWESMLSILAIGLITVAIILVFLSKLFIRIIGLKIKQTRK